MRQKKNKRNPGGTKGGHAMFKWKQDGPAKKGLRAVADGVIFAVTAGSCFFALRDPDRAFLRYGKWDYLFACVFLLAALLIFRAGFGVFSRPWAHTDGAAAVRFLLAEFVGGAVGAVVCLVASVYHGIGFFLILLPADTALALLLRLTVCLIARRTKKGL